MIRLNIYCGLGNQMFSYAFARALSGQYNGEVIVLNKYFGKLVNMTTPSGAIKPDNRLRTLVLNENVKEISLINGYFWAAIDFLIYSFYRFVVKIDSQKFIKLSTCGRYIHPGYVQFEYFDHKLTDRKRKIVSGYFGSERFFKDIKSIIMKEMTVKISPSEDNKRKIEELSSCNSVCVHIRRGDYTVNQSYSQYLAICTETYYQRGMDYIFKHTEDPIFYIFSNTCEDLNWIKENYHFTYPVKYIELNNPDYEELRLMYTCKHFVISNSTFSWWGSYLSQNPNKIVVAPDRWLGVNSDKRFRNQDYIDIYRDDMIKIHVDLEERK